MFQAANAATPSILLPTPSNHLCAFRHSCAHVLTMSIPIVSVAGKQDVEKQTVSARSSQNGELGTITITELQERMQTVIHSKGLF